MLATLGRIVGTVITFGLLTLSVGGAVLLLLGLVL